jgi:hypothetical protein
LCLGFDANEFIGNHRPVRISLLTVSIAFLCPKLNIFECHHCIGDPVKFLKYGFLVLVLSLVTAVVYFRLIKQPRPYESWPIVQKHACVFGANYFSYLFKSNLDSSKINSECINDVNSSLQTKSENGYYIGLFCGKGAALAHDNKIPEQNTFLKKGVDNLLSEDHAKTIDLIRLCVKAVEMKFDPIYKELNANADISTTVDLPPRNLYLEFTNIRCGVASSPPCFD